MKNKFILYYLPYDVKVLDLNKNKKLKLVPSYLPKEIKGFRTLSIEDYLKNESNYVLLLRPMSELNSIVEHFFSKMIPSRHLNIDPIDAKKMAQHQELVKEVDYPYSIVHKLMSLHFDVFGLLNAGLAKRIEE